MTLTELLQQATRTWQRTGVEILPPANEGRIRAVMHEIGRPLSSDVIKLYQSTGGFTGGTDAHVWSLWSLDRVCEVNREYRGPLTAFSDGLIDSFYFCFRYENESISSVWIDHMADTELIRVAGSVTDFFDRYLREPGALGLYDGRYRDDATPSSHVQFFGSLLDRCQARSALTVFATTLRIMRSAHSRTSIHTFVRRAGLLASNPLL